jgi:peptide/nickel transport system substrate-binding protein
MDRSGRRAALRREVRSFRGPTGLGTVLSVVILVAVLVVAGVATYVAFPATKTVCAPASSPACAASTHDISLLVPLKTVQQGTPIPFTAILPSSETSSNFTFNFGDGTQAYSTTGTVTHTYSTPGQYIVSVSAMIGGTAHDNAHDLALVSVAPSYAFDSLGTIPTALGTLVRNTTSTTNPTGLLHPGESVTVSGAYTVPPTNPLYSYGTPRIIASGGSLATGPSTTTSAQATVTFSTPGTYTVTFVGSGVATGQPSAYQNYTWTVIVAKSGVNMGFSQLPAVASPHKGEVTSYEYYPGGATTFDPAIDYDIAGFEVISNVYQTLIMYNGSSAGPNPSDFIPVIATCVPGSAQCTSLYGNDLVQGTNYTFVISSTPKFYDPYDTVNGAHPSWGVYPSDVMFSVFRTMGWAQEPYPFFTNGWILSQSLLPGGNGSWDSGIHGTFNNTPENMYAAMSINDSRWCPQIAMTQAHGCITFHANASNGYGNAWPFFLELIGDQQGGDVVPCGWFSMPAQGQGIPGWTANDPANQGPHPCAPPTTAQIASWTPTLLDGWEVNYFNATTSAYAGNTQWRTVGSGPYYLVDTQVGKSYDLAANPAYQANPECTWSTCQPPAGSYVPAVHVIWETDQVQGEQAYASGVADFASIPTTDTGFLIQLIEKDKANAIVVPSLGANVLLFAFQFSKARENTYTSNPVTIPSDFFSHIGMRQFLAHAYPYASIESTVNTVDGIQYGFDYGGAIPDFMGNYYPHNIDWPSGNPCTSTTDPSCPAYWWAAMQNSSSPYYDPEVAQYCPSAAHPCQFPVYGSQGAPDEDERLTLFIQSVDHVSGGAMKLSLVDLTGTELYYEGSAGPGTNALPMEIGLWYPDYPDPTDYVYPFYYPDATFTFPEATAEGIGSSYSVPTPNAYNGTLPNGTKCPTDYNFYVNISHYGYPIVPQSCQGAAYDSMIGLLTTAGALPASPQRVLEFDQAEQIANQLAIMINEYQANIVESYAAWISPSSLSTNVIYAGTYLWWMVNGNGVM